LIQEHGNWSISGIVDMEVASAGDPYSDLVSLCAGLAQRLPAAERWWIPLFMGYGSEPDINLVRLYMLVGWYPYQADVWPGVGENAFRHLLQAENWETLFSHTHLPLSQ